MAMNPLPHLAAIVDGVFGRATTTGERTAVALSQIAKLDDGQLLEAVPLAPRIGPAPPEGEPDHRDVNRAAMTDAQIAAAAVWAFQDYARVTWRVWNRQNRVGAAARAADGDAAPL